MKRHLLAALVIVGSLAPSFYLARRATDLPNLGQAYDDGIYWLTASSIASGQGYRLPYLPGQPAQTLLPPGYPLLLSIAWRVGNQFPSNAPLGLWSSWLLFPVLLLLVDRLAVAWGAGAARRSVLLLWLGWNPIVLYLSVTLLSELMFSGLLILCLLLVMRGMQPETSARWALFAGIVAGGAYLTRNAGLILLPAGMLSFGLRRLPRKAALFLTGMLPAMAAWQIWIRTHVQDTGAQGYRTYFSHYSGLSATDLWTIVCTNIQLLLLHTGGLLVYSVEGFPRARMAVMTIGAAAWAIFLVCGLYRATQKDRLTACCAGAFYLALLVVWPIPTASRFLIPMVPVLMAGLCCFVRGGWMRDPVAVTLLGLAGVFNIFIGYGAFHTVLPGELAEQRHREEQNQPLYSWLRANCQGAMLVSRNAPDAYLRTGCTSIEPTIPVRDWYRGAEQLDTNQNRRLLEVARDRGSFLLIDCSGLAQRTEPPCGMDPDLWRTLPHSLAVATPAAQLYRIEKERADDGDRRTRLPESNTAARP